MPGRFRAGRPRQCNSKHQGLFCSLRHTPQRSSLQKAHSLQSVQSCLRPPGRAEGTNTRPKGVLQYASPAIVTTLPLSCLFSLSAISPQTRLSEILHFISTFCHDAYTKLHFNKRLRTNFLQSRRLQGPVFFPRLFDMEKGLERRQQAFYPQITHFFTTIKAACRV